MHDYLGERLRIAQVTKKLTLRALSEKSGLSKSLISQIERGEAKPSLASLTKLALSLDVSLSSLFSESRESAAERSQKFKDLPHIYLAPSLSEAYISECQVTRRYRRKSVSLPGSNIRYSMVTPDLNRKIQVLHMTAQSGEDSGNDLFIHDGEECCIMLRGKIEIRVGDETFQLEEGDSLYLPGKVPHYWRNVGDDQIELMWVRTPPAF